MNGEQDLKGCSVFSLLKEIVTEKRAKLISLFSGLFSCLHFLVYESWSFYSFLELILGYVKGDQSLINSFDCHGRTPLHLAVKWGNTGAAKLMVYF